MLARSHRINTRASALEAYVGSPKEHTGMTITGRLEAQHRLLLALRDDHNDLRVQMQAFRAHMEEFRAHVEERFTKVESRLTSIEDVMGRVLWGMTEIKNLLKPTDHSP
jgi:hypothetical protein